MSLIKLLFFPLLILFIFLEIYVVFVYPEGTSFTSYLASIYQVLIGEKENQVIRINLYNRILTTFQDGKLVKQDKIAGAGHPKISPTPKGNFKILSKEKTRFSFHQLIMPLALRFYNGYYLHGMPYYYPSGKKVETVYSLGCIRLPAGADEEIYKWAEIGTRVEIYQAELVKSSEKQTVYHLSKAGTKRKIPTPEIFNSYEYQWEEVAVVPSEELESYPDVNLIKVINDDKIYKIENGKKRLIKSAEVFKRLGYDWSLVDSINILEFETYAFGDEIE